MGRRTNSSTDALNRLRPRRESGGGEWDRDWEAEHPRLRDEPSPRARVDDRAAPDDDWVAAVSYDDPVFDDVPGPPAAEPDDDPEVYDWEAAAGYGDQAAESTEPPADAWGATALPAWLDTPAGRRSWSARSADSARPDRNDWQDRGDSLDRDSWHDPLRPGLLESPAEPVRNAVTSRVEATPDDRYDSDHRPDPDDWSADDWDDPPPRRFALLPPAAIALIGVGVIACAVAAFALLRGNEAVVPLVDFPVSAGPSAPAAAPSPGSSTAAPAEIVVSVAGLVHRPGLIRLPPDARVAQALERAGGARDGADVLSLNLAQVLRDGDQILVGTRENGSDSVRSAVVASGAASAGGAAGVGGTAPGAGSGTAGGAARGPVNLNTATAAELDTLPGVGPVTAQAIIAWRQQHDGFASVDQLGEVDGIGPARLAKLRDLVTVGR